MAKKQPMHLNVFCDICEAEPGEHCVKGRRAKSPWIKRTPFLEGHPHRLFLAQQIRYDDLGTLGDMMTKTERAEHDTLGEAIQEYIRKNHTAYNEK